MASEQDLFLGIEVTWIWLALLIFLLFRIEKPAKYYYQLGLKAVEEKNFDAAILYFKSALTKKSNYPEVRARLGELYVDLGDARSAECLIKQNIKHNFELEKSVLLLAKIYFYQSKIDELDKHVQCWQMHIDLSHEVKEKLKLYTNLVLVHRRALPSPTPVAKPDIFDLTRDF
jgi:tetratricopeptide (TPR) repeat protein